MATEFDSGSGGGSKRQRTDDEGEQAAADVEVAEEDRISTLPEALRLDILSLLPLKSAIRTGALSTQWRALWTRRWPAPSSLEFRVPAQDSPQQLMETLERRGRRRLDRLSLSFQTGELKAEGFRHLLAYAAACAVADIDVHLTNANEVSGRFFKFRLPPGNPHLERLSLSGNRIKLYDSSRSDSRPYSVLEAIHLHRVTVSDDTIFDLVAACPLLRTLDLRYCKGLRSGNLPAGSNLKSVTVAECESVADVSINNNSGLRSFRYSGGYLHADQIPTTIDDLYLCFGGPARRNCSGTTSWTEAYDGEWRLCKLRRSCLDALIDVSNLTVLTLCSSALRRVSGKARAKSLAGNAALCKLRNLREVQLMMFALYDENLDDIMDFLIICCSSRLERLFVQLPTRSDQYKPDEEPSETEDDGSEDVLSEEDEEEERRSWGYKSENEELEQELSEEEESDEDQSEEVELEEMELGENHSKEDESEEQGSPEGQSKEDGSKKELSDGGQSAEEPLGDGCENLMLLKMENFKGHHNEMRLVSFVLKKSARLNQLILFTPSDHPDGLHKDHLNTSEFLETKLLPVEKASPNAQIILSEPDDTAVQPLHWETFVEV